MAVVLPFSKSEHALREKAGAMVEKTIYLERNYIIMLVK